MNRESRKLSQLDKQLLEAEKFKLVFLVNKFFENVNKMDEVIAVPFVVTANVKNIHTDCDHLFEDVLKDKTQIFYCSESTYIENFVKTGAKLLKCTECPLYTTHNNKRR
jgi:hypothetical protein